VPTYYFHLREDGDVTIDTEGITLPDIVAAARHAAAEARGMVSVELCYGEAVDLTRRLEVVDEPDRSSTSCHSTRRSR
jgi:hypothetical protein